MKIELIVYPNLYHCQFRVDGVVTKPIPVTLDGKSITLVDLKRTLKEINESE